MAKHTKTPPHDAGHDSAKLPHADRRRWLKAGLSTPPVLMTVASRPVLAQECVTPSAFLSCAASGPAGSPPPPEGRSPSDWSNSSDWPSPYYPGKAAEKGVDKPAKVKRLGSDTFDSVDDQATRFNAVFDPDLSGNPSLSDVLGNDDVAQGSDEVRMVARYVTAALLNNAAGKVPNTVLSQTTILAIWSEYGRTGAFAPTRGVSWSGAQIVEYLRSTMTNG